MENKELKLKIEKKLNKEFIGQEQFFKDMTEYFVDKIEKKEKGIVLVSGQTNTFKKVSVKAVFEELYEEKIINNRNLDEIDLSAYNFNMGYNAFLTDLYEKLNSNTSDAIMFKNTENTVTRFGTITISKACRNSFKAACKYPPNVANAVINMYSLIIGTSFASKCIKSISGIAASTANIMMMPRSMENRIVG